MNFIDLLLESKLPAWSVLIIIAAGFLAIVYYKFLLNLKLKKFEHSFKEDAIKHDKILELAQEKYRKRLDALSKINRPLMEFHHAIMHTKQGDKGYIKNIERYYKEIRSLSRDYEFYLGNKFYKAIISYTDEGKDVTNPDVFNYNKYCDEENRIKDLIEKLQSTFTDFNEKN